MRNLITVQPAASIEDQPRPTSNIDDSSGSTRKRKRQLRAAVACERCRQRKVRCDGDGAQPCGGCIKSSVAAYCGYVQSQNRTEAQASRSVRLAPSNNNGGAVDATPATEQPHVAVDHQQASLRRLVARTPQHNSATVESYQNSHNVDQGKHRNQPTGLVSVPENQEREQLPGGLLSLRTPESSGVPGLIDSGMPRDREPCQSENTAAVQDWASITQETLGSGFGESHRVAPMACSTTHVGPRADDDDGEADAVAGREGGAGGFGSVNLHTKGVEFYGNMGILPFLARLRQRARLHSRRQGEHQRGSIVSYLHNSDYPVPPSRPRSPPPPSDRSRRRSISAQEVQEPVSNPTSMPRDNAIIYIRVFFTTLHLMHPILNEDVFIERCKREIWDTDGAERRGTSRSFQAVYYVVLALGAIVFYNDAFGSFGPVTAMPGGTRNPELLDTRSHLEIAKNFFEAAKANLGDIFEVSSLESTQALFLLSVFCQNALKPHSCYLFSGMAARTAVAIGLLQENGGQGRKSAERLRAATSTWWCIYTHEVEMCCASGRDTFLKAPFEYSLPLPNGALSHDSSGNTHTEFISVMVSLANILKRTSEGLYQTPLLPLEDQSHVARGLDRALDEWKRNLPAMFLFDKVSLTEPERVSRQKVVLKLRYYSARILLYRRFVELWSSGPEARLFIPDVNACLHAARETIRLLFDTYLHRPYFRTWWYNTTYLLNASIITLYVVFTGVHDVTIPEIFEDVEKALDIFNAMGSVVVARRCEQLVREVYEVAKMVANERSTNSGVAHGNAMASGAAQDLGMVSADSQAASGQQNSKDYLQDDIWASLFGQVGADHGGLSSLQDLNFDFGLNETSWNTDISPGVTTPGVRNTGHFQFADSDILF